MYQIHGLSDDNLRAAALLEEGKKWRERVEARCGVPLAEIPMGTLHKGGLDGHIMCSRRTDCTQEYILGVGYPDVEEDGTEVYTSFEYIVLFTEEYAVRTGVVPLVGYSRKF